MVPMRERDDDAPGQDSGSLAGGLGETASGDGTGDTGGDTYGDGAVDDAPLPSDPDTSVADGSVDGTFDTGADEPADGTGGTVDGAGLDLGGSAQSHTVMDGIEYLVDELREAVLGADDDPAVTDPDPGDGLDDGTVGL
jgi:hypothetical protein